MDANQQRQVQNPTRRVLTLSPKTKFFNTEINNHDTNEPTTTPVPNLVPSIQPAWSQRTKPQLRAAHPRRQLQRPGPPALGTLAIRALDQRRTTRIPPGALHHEQQWHRPE